MVMITSKPLILINIYIIKKLPTKEAFFFLEQNEKIRFFI